MGEKSNGVSYTYFFYQNKEYRMNNAVTRSHYDNQSLARQAKLIVRGQTGGFEVEWDQDAKVTPLGTIVYFAQYLNTGGLMDFLCEGAPMAYTSNNAPTVRNVLGTMVLSVLNGDTRYAHINALRHDRVGPEVLGMTKMVSEDSVRRALKRGQPQEWDDWLLKLERSVWEPLLTESYVLDVDSTVKPIYGHQEGAELGYNPKKPGRPSHNYHTYFIGALRLVLSTEVLPGKAHSGGHGMPALWALVDSLPPHLRPRLIRADVSYGSEAIMVEAEQREQAYLFKLRRSGNVRAQFKTLCAPEEGWTNAGEGWEATEHRMRLCGWTCERRCIFLRRPAKKSSATERKPGKAQPEFDFVQGTEGDRAWEYVVLVTNDEKLTPWTISQCYRDRADCENVFDEIKNQWGWSGFMTQDLQRCRIIARFIALVYNWWSIFVRLAQPNTHLEAVTSRPLLLNTVGRLVVTGRRKIVRLTSNHALAEKVRLALEAIGGFLNRLARTAEQLKPAEAWALILSAAFIKWLKGKVLHPVSDGDQMLLKLHA